MGIAINPLMAINLSPEDYAIIGYFNSFSLIVLPILNFSLITYYLRNYFIIPEEKRQLVTDTILITLLVYGFFALILIYIIFYTYFKLNNVTFSFFPYAILAFLPIYLTNFQTLYLVKCRMQREAGKFSKVMIMGSLLTALFSVILVVVYKYGAAGKLLAPLLAMLLIAAYSFKQLYGKLQFDFSIVKDAFKFGWPLSLSALLWYFLSGVDSAMLERLDDPHTFGYYNVGLQIAGYFAIFHTAISQSFEPNVYKAIADNDKRKLAKIVIGISFLNALPNLIFIIFATAIISFLTYGRYTEAAGFAQILSLKNITVSMFYLLTNIMVGYGFNKSELLIRGGGAVLCFSLFYIMIENYGFMGAAWGHAMAFVIMISLTLGFLSYKLKINYARLWNTR